jgi:hypothetical protein
MLLIGQERTIQNAALAVESRCNPIVLVATNADSSRVSGSYNRRAGAADAVKKLCLSRLGSTANSFPAELRLLTREIRNASPLGNDEVAQASLE